MKKKSTPRTSAPKPVSPSATASTPSSKNAVLTATLAWNGAVLSCSHDEPQRTELFARNAVRELRLTYRPSLVAGPTTAFLAAPTLLPNNLRIRYRIVSWTPQGDELQVVLRRD